jgi:hypothetical protein
MAMAIPRVRSKPFQLKGYFRKKKNQGQGGDGQQVEQVHSDRKAHHVGDQHQPAPMPGLICPCFPFEHQPKYKGGKKAAQGINFCLYGIEPDGIGKGTGQASGGSRQQAGDGPAGFRPVIGLGAFPGQPTCNPAGKQAGKCSGQHAQQVDHQGDAAGISQGQHGKYSAQQQVEGRPRRVGYLQLVGAGNEFPTIPKTGRRSHGQGIGNQGDGEDQPAYQLVEFAK